MAASQPPAHPRLAVDLSAVVVAVTDEVPRVLTVAPPPHARAAETGSPPEAATLPFGPFDADGDRTLDRALRRWVTDQTGLALGYVEQLYTFGDRWRDPREARGGPRTVSVAYLALVREAEVGDRRDAGWRACYELFPWEDHRAGRPAVLSQQMEPALVRWADQGSTPAERHSRRERVDIAFGLGSAGWDGERVLERYELLYEAGLVAESARDAGLAASTSGAGRRPAADVGDPGLAMALDHRRIAATALSRLRGKLSYRPVVFELLPAEFTLLHLQGVVEALAGVRLHKQNFRRLVERGRLVEGTGAVSGGSRGRPAELFRFRREVLRERPAPGVGLPEDRSRA